MKDRIIKGWNFRRLLYVIVGVIVIAQSVSQSLWAGIALGAYFASMGLFAFGCAAGNCSYVPAKRNTNQSTID